METNKENIKINKENIRINKENIKELNKIYVHDFYSSKFDYSIDLEKISVDFISSSSEFKNIEIIFSNVVFFKYTNAYFWGDGETVNDIYLDKENRSYQILENEYNEYNEEFKKLNGRDSLYPKRLNKEDLIDIVIHFINGNEMCILCKNIDVIYLDKD